MQQNIQQSIGTCIYISIKQNMHFRCTLSQFHKQANNEVKLTLFNISNTNNP